MPSESPLEANPSCVTPHSAAEREIFVASLYSPQITSPPPIPQSFPTPVQIAPLIRTGWTHRSGSPCWSVRGSHSQSLLWPGKDSKSQPPPSHCVSLGQPPGSYISPGGGSPEVGQEAMTAPTPPHHTNHWLRSASFPMDKAL